MVADPLFAAALGPLAGLQLDLVTVTAGIIGIVFLLIAFDKVRDALSSALSERTLMSSRSEMQKQKSIIDNDYIDDVDRDIARARYRSALSKIR